jgi:DNA-binding beta-propeller fold protein YncE
MIHKTRLGPVLRKEAEKVGLNPQQTPVAVAVNPVTNKIHVVNETNNNATVIDGATNTTGTVAARASPKVKMPPSVAASQ